jgi:ABC-type uncharacterized transport system involved in gliding motility auxiliary subunit
VTSQISLLNMQSAGILQAKKEASIKFEPLVTTSADSQEIDVEMLKGEQPKILTMIENFKPSGKPLVLAARVSGRTTTLFPDGPPKEEEKKEEAPKDEGKKDESKKDDGAAGTATGSDAPKEAPANAAPAEKTPESGETKPSVKADIAERAAAPQVAQSETKPAETKPADAKPATDEKPAAAPAETPKAAEEKPAEKAEAEKKEEPAPQAPPFVKESTAPMNVIVVADADMLEDRFWVQNRDFFGQRVQVPFANNADFVVNAVENLAGGDDLIGLRSRGTAQRPFTKIAELKLEADQKYRAEEQGLRKKLADAEKKLSELEKKKAEGASDAAVDEAVKATAVKFTEEVLSTRKALRKVQLALRENIESLESWLYVINIAFIPIVVGIFAIVLGLVRMRRRKHHGGTPAA